MGNPGGANSKGSPGVSICALWKIFLKCKILNVIHPNSLFWLLPDLNKGNPTYLFLIPWDNYPKLEIIFLLGDLSKGDISVVDRRAPVRKRKWHQKSKRGPSAPAQRRRRRLRKRSKRCEARRCLFTRVSIRRVLRTDHELQAINSGSTCTKASCWIIVFVLSHDS